MEPCDADFPALPLTDTDPRWVEVALTDLDAVYSDHLHCERKAALSALSLIRAYPGHAEVVAQLSRLAHEETSHVVQVGQLLSRTGTALRHDFGDDYAHALRRYIRKGEPARLLDRLLVFGLIEARSAQRLGLLAAALTVAQGAPLYRALATAEVRHRDMFLRLTTVVVPAAEAAARTRELAAVEAEIVAALPLLPRIH
jgi:tRNA-(ms[2]io[6]A)-hydroxylase